MTETTRKTETLEKIKDSPRLPSLPSVALEVLELTRQPDAKMQDIAAAISNDPALASKIIKTVNSSYYGLSQSVSTIQHAMVMLGLNSVKTLALGFSLLHGMKIEMDGDSFDMMLFWRNSLYSAVAARTLGTHAKISAFEEAFLAALLQDIGIVIMLETLRGEYLQVITKSGDDHEELIKNEIAKYGLSHAEVGAVIAGKWKFPDILLEPIRYSDTPADSPSDVKDVTHAVALGCVAARVVGTSKVNPYDLREFHALTRKWFKMNSDESEACLKEIGHGAREISKLFELSTNGLPDPEDILSQANEALTQLALQSAHDSKKLEEEKRELERKATIDGLTGVANRGKLNDYVQEAYETACITNSPFSLIFVDADKFKSINDTHGHAAGDCVLRALASALIEAIPPDGLVGRYGGEEFAIALPNMKLIPAAKLAEKIRIMIGELVIPAGEDLELKVTVSMGVSTTNGGREFERYEQLIDAADRAVYAAKASGRNCVRIFTPSE